MKGFTKGEQRIILIIVLLVAIIFSFKFFIREIIGDKTESLEIDKNFIISNDIIEDGIIEDSKMDQEVKTIMVHISGAVHNPGVIELELGKRLIDAVQICGGLKDDADIDRINLARKLADEEKVYIPKIGEEISEELSFVSEGSREKDSGKININTCSKAELLSLPGIGDVLADRIIEYREKNPFKRIEDIKNVSGIGDKKFESIEDLITVN